ncbi:surface-adhesin E family protein [Melioribacter sp. OK-6-Me]|uniref:surface-adhesin E family protein n=1 Tax=unclassified Melioribacter TaxID=2627329 RepID=UPI003EDA14D5
MLDLIYILQLIILLAQTDAENWVPVENYRESKIYVDASSLKKYDDDYYVWVLEEHDPPISIESIDKKIYKTKTYLIINKPSKRYSIIQIIFYDINNNVLKSYSYNISELVKYTSPILEGSKIESVMIKCIMLSDIKKAKSN